MLRRRVFLMVFAAFHPVVIGVRAGIAQEIDPDVDVEFPDNDGRDGSEGADGSDPDVDVEFPDTDEGGIEPDPGRGGNAEQPETSGATEQPGLGGSAGASGSGTHDEFVDGMRVENVPDGFHIERGEEGQLQEVRDNVSPTPAYAQSNDNREETESTPAEEIEAPAPDESGLPSPREIRGLSSSGTENLHKRAERLFPAKQR